MPGKPLRKGSMAELKATNVPKMYQPTASKGLQMQREKNQTYRYFANKRSAYEAKQKAAQRRLLAAAHVAFPAATPQQLAIERKRTGFVRKWRKGKTKIPREIKKLAYKGPKQSPVDEEEEGEQEGEEGAPMEGGMPPPPVGKGTQRRKRTRSKEVPDFAMASFAEETEEEVKEAAKGAIKAPTLSDTLKSNPDYPKLKVPRTRRKGKRSVLGYAPDEDRLGPLGWGGSKRRRGRGTRKTRRRRH